MDRFFRGTLLDFGTMAEPPSEMQNVLAINVAVDGVRTLSRVTGPVGCKNNHRPQ